MMRISSVVLLGSAVAGCSILVACSNSGGSSSQSSPQPTATAAAAASPSTATASPATSPTISVSFTDIAGTYGEQDIRDEAQLGVFPTTTGAFRPNDPISRGDYVQWLVTANNLYFADDSTSQLRFPSTNEDTFLDVTPSSPYWKYVQALVDAGFVIGVDATHFAPDRPITRQEMVAIKYQVDAGQKATPDPNLTAQQISELSDADQVAPIYVTAVYDDLNLNIAHNIGRIWGKTAYFHPTRQLTRAEAAISLAEIGDKQVTDVLQSGQ